MDADRDADARRMTTEANVKLGYSAWGMPTLPVDDQIRIVKVQPLNIAFQDRRARMVARIMKPLVDKPALFVRLRGDEEQIAAIRKKLGSRLAYEDTIAMPVPDPDKVAWAISAHLPERIGQNQGGQRRRRRR